jgi:hypothetical protein
MRARLVTRLKKEVITEGLQKLADCWATEREIYKKLCDWTYLLTYLLMELRPS